MARRKKSKEKTSDVQRDGQRGPDLQVLGPEHVQTVLADLRLLSALRGDQLRALVHERGSVGGELLVSPESHHFDLAVHRLVTQQ